MVVRNKVVAGAGRLGHVVKSSSSYVSAVVLVVSAVSWSKKRNVYVTATSKLQMMIDKAIYNKKKDNVRNDVEIKQIS